MSALLGTDQFLGPAREGADDSDEVSDNDNDDKDEDAEEREDDDDRKDFPADTENNSQSKDQESSSAQHGLQSDLIQAMLQSLASRIQRDKHQTSEPKQAKNSEENKGVSVELSAKVSSDTRLRDNSNKHQHVTSTNIGASSNNFPHWDQVDQSSGTADIDVDGDSDIVFSSLEREFFFKKKILNFYFYFLCHFDMGDLFGINFGNFFFVPTTTNFYITFT